MRCSPGILLVCVCLVAGCENDADRRRAIDDYVRGAAELPAGEAGRVQESAATPIRDGDFSCSYRDVDETVTIDRVVAYAANSDGLWPGALLAGRSVADGLFTQRALSRAPLTYSISLENLAGAKQARLETPSLSSYRESLGELLAAEVSGATSANLYAEIEEVHSKEQLDLALAAQVSWFSGFGASFAASFDFSTESVRSRFLVRYVQSYYTVDLDPPERPSSVFAPSVDVDAVRAQFAPDDPAVYVSSISYGRMIVFAVESEFAATELRAALEFAYGFSPRITGDVSVSYEELLDRSKITAFVLGGSGGAAAASISDYESMIDLIANGGDYSRDSPGAPIAYRLSYLADNSPARLALTREYTVKECARVNQRVLATLRGIRVEEAGDDGSELELYGLINVHGEGEEESLFDRDSANLVQIAEGSTYPQNGPLGEAIVSVTPNMDGLIQFRLELVDRDSGWFGLFGSDDSLGIIWHEVPFETGWRRDIIVHLSTAGGARVEALLSLLPI